MSGLLCDRLNPSNGSASVDHRGFRVPPRATLGRSTVSFVHLGIKCLFSAWEGLEGCAAGAPARTLFQLFQTNSAFSCCYKTEYVNQGNKTSYSETDFCKPALLCDRCCFIFNLTSSLIANSPKLPSEIRLQETTTESRRNDANLHLETGIILACYFVRLFRCHHFCLL